jgi:hypothetical protein
MQGWPGESFANLADRFVPAVVVVDGTFAVVELEDCGYCRAWYEDHPVLRE